VEHVIERLINGREVATTELKRIFGELCQGRPYPPEQLAALLVLMRARGETAEQLAGLAETILEQAVPIDVPAHATTIGGTGGDYAGTFNISTAAALLTAACGVPVAKHGNRAVSSQCGSGDVLEALGIPIDFGPADAEHSLAEHGFVFLAAPVYLPAFKYIAPVRAALKVPSIFNVIGPLLHPGHLKRQIIGVFDRSLQDKMAEALLRLGHVHTLVVTSADGLDEITVTGPTYAKEIVDDRIADLVIDPGDFGFTECSMQDLAGGDANENAQIIRDFFAGAKGSKSDCVILNTAFALYVSGKVTTPSEGVDMAQTAQQSGAALSFLNRLCGLG
jgi:anthranilate phosphoribosyltransferase